MSRKRIWLLIIISVMIVICMIMGISYAFFSGGKNIANGNILYDASFSNGNYNFTAAVNSASTSGINLNLTAAKMIGGNEDTVADSQETIFNISFQNTSSSQAYCAYDYVWVWNSSSTNHYVKSTGALKELTVSYLDGEGQVQDWGIESFVVASAVIEANANATTARQDVLTTKFYNLANVDQSGHMNKSYSGYLAVAHAHCYSKTGSYPLTDYIAHFAPRSGTDAVSSSPWILTSDHGGEYRYAGKNPDNYISFNGELWRIVGVMPNMEYCTGTYGSVAECNTTSTGSLVKIVRNDSLGTFVLDNKRSGIGSNLSAYFGSNDWSDSQLMLMLNGTNYLKTGYDVNGNKLHTRYTIENNIVKDANGYAFYNATYSYLDGNGTNVYIPSAATTSSYTATSGTVSKKIDSTALAKIATVKWDLYGTNSYGTAAQGSPIAFYNKERNIGSIGAVYTDSSLSENRPIYWYGKISLMYPSDYGYATNGGSTYNRSTCLGYQMSGWNSGSYTTDCAGGSYLWYINITSTAPGSSGTNLHTIIQNSSTPTNFYIIRNTGYLSSLSSTNNYVIRPVLYLKADTLYGGSGNGTWNNPYTIS